MDRGALKRIACNEFAICIAIFVFSLLLRAFFAYQWQGTPYGASPLLDAQAYDAWAQKIARGQLFRDRAFYQSPLYPYVLGAFYWLLGHNLFFVGLLNAVLSAATAALLGAIAFFCFGAPAAWATGLLAAFDRLMIFYAAPVMKESLALLLLAIFLYAVLKSLTHKGKYSPLIAGLGLGLGVLVRGNFLFLAPVYIALIFWRWRRSAWRMAGCFSLALLVCLAPAMLHNYAVSGDFVLVNYADGFNLYIGHSETANGANAYPPEVSTDPVQEEYNVAWLAERAAGRPLKPSEISHYWRSRAVAYAVAHPLHEWQLLRDRTAVFFNNAEKFDNYEISFVRAHFDTILDWPLIGFGVLFVLSVVAGVVGEKKSHCMIVCMTVLAASYAVSVLIFYVTDRYRLPVVVFLLPLAGYAVQRLIQLYQTRSWRLLFVASLVALACSYVTYQPDAFAVDLTAFNWGTLSTIYAERDQPEKAVDAFQHALAVSPIEAGAAAFAQSAFAEKKLGREAEAERLMEWALVLYPNDGILRYNYARMLAMNGDIPSALKAVQKAVVLSPSYLLNYYALAKFHARLGHHAEAVEAVRAGLAVDPHDALLLVERAELQGTRD